MKPSGKNHKSNSNKKKFTSNKKTANTKKSNANTQSSSSDVRLNKFISNSGICSRREADVHIAMGLVSVNGKVVTEMGYRVKEGDEVRYDGSRVNPEPKTYVLLNKPKGFATTTSDAKGRTVMDLVANASGAKLKPIGRLGRNSTGLLLFTNDAEVTKKFTNSKDGVVRIFQISLDKNLKPSDLSSIKEGFKIDGKLIQVEEISFIEGSPKTEIGLKIKNTGNTIIRTIFEHFNYDIIKIDCVAIAHLTKKDLPRGRWKYLSEQEISLLKMM